MTRSRMLCTIGLAAVLMLGLVACQGSRTSSYPVATTSAAPPAAAAPTAMSQPAPQPMGPSPAVQAQIDRGASIYAASCASCHGSMGQGGARAPALIGPSALPAMPPPGRRVRTGRFDTAMDLGMFIKTNMPLGGQHLPPTDVAAVMAWILKSNGITPPTTISPSTAGSIRLH